MNERKDKLKSAGLTQETAAEQLRASRPSLARWVAGGSQLGSVTLEVEGEIYQILVPIDLGIEVISRNRPVPGFLSPVKKDQKDIDINVSD